MEWDEAVDVALFACGSETQRTCVVESLWQKLGRPLPLLGIVVHRVENDLQQVTLLEVILAKLKIVPRVVVMTDLSRSLEAKRLLHHHGREIQVLCRLHRHHFVEELALGQRCEAWIFVECGLQDFFLELLPQLGERDLRFFLG